jgi:hypothetical protein
MVFMQCLHPEGPRLLGAVRRGPHPRTARREANLLALRALPHSAAARRAGRREEFENTVTFCFTPESEGIAPHHTSPPKDPMYFADFCARMIERYAPRQQQKAVA